MEKKIQAYPPQADICAFVSTSLETKRAARRPSQGSGRPKCKRERVAEDRFGSRLCENVHEPRMPRIVFSIAFFREKLPVQLVSASMKSRRKFYTQVRRRSFHTAWVKSAILIVRRSLPLYPQLR